MAIVKIPSPIFQIELNEEEARGLSNLLDMGVTADTLERLKLIPLWQELLRRLCEHKCKFSVLAQLEK
jgi:hypothetical protein